MTFIPDMSVLAAFTVAGLILFLTPGPDMSLWLSRTLSGGRSLGFAAMLGTCLGCCVHATLAALGISALISASPVAFNVMKVVGALYLLWLAVQILRKGTVLDIRDTPEASRVHRLVPAFVTGILVNLSNPKVVLFFITFLPGFVSAADPHAAGKLFFLGVYFAVLNVILSTVLIQFADRFVSVIRRNPSVMKAIDYAFAGVFGVFAVVILRTQAKV